MAKQSREKLKKTKARKEKRAKAAKAARAGEKADDSGTPMRDQRPSPEGRPFSVDSVGRSIGGGGGGGGTRIPRRTKTG